MFKSDDTGKLVLRLALGILILLHGIAKLKGGVGFISGQLTAHGLPAALAYGAYIGEVVAPILVIVGFFTRPAAWIIAINMVFAIFLVHMADLGAMTKQGGWALELQGMFLFAAIAVGFMGAGRLSLGGSTGKFN
ncbi:DoxX family protein [Variovorax sp. PAMC 28711]|uniref:DoxX family protein n=1 Tax=Variovorax sp. PAMC 28711 TaxID=1795631 RepID=UPI00078C81AF|nr:DoxX family protein [Variovorax sp. PAMC 28711]AMM26414.1 GntR family transcriptional regulator [Variovorax sp. PAMC 28711]